MPVFAYRATDEQGRIVDGQIEARNSDAVVERLQRLSFYPLEIKAAEEGGEEEGGLTFRLGRGKKVAFFTSQLATLLEAGLPMDRSLAITKELTGDKAFAGIVGRVRSSVEEGSTLADALAEQGGRGGWFSDLYVSMVRAGESGGVLEVVLRRLADFLEETQRTRDFILSALAYPIFLVLFSALSLTVIFVTVLPQFARIFADMGAVVPLPARILMGVSDFIGKWWWALLGGIAGIVFAFRSWIGTEEGRSWWDRSRLGWPVLGPLLAKLETARFARTLGTLLGSGVPILQAVDIVGQTVGNRHIASFMGEVKNGLKKGEGLVAPLRKSGVFPPLFIHMATVGEETGRPEEMLTRVASIYEREIESATRGLLSLLEPVIIVVLGITIGAIILSILWAIFSVYSVSF